MPVSDLIPTNIDAILVEFLDDTYLPVLLKEHPILDRITKKAMGGSAAKVPLQIGPGGGVSGTFSDALQNAKLNGAVNAAFDVTPAVIYGIELIDWATQPYTDTPQSATDILTLATTNAMILATDNFATMIFSDGFGTMSTILSNSTPGGTVFDLVLGVPTDVAKFNIEHQIVTKATPAAAALRTGGAIVTGLNQINGSIRVDAGASGWTPTNGDVIGLDGQMKAQTTPVTFPGIFGFIPKLASRTLGVIGGTFLGVDRSAASGGVAVGGWAFTAVGGPVFPVVNNAAGYMASYKHAKPTELYCNPVTMAKFANEVDQKVRYDMPSKTGVADVFYAGFTIHTAAGAVDVLAEAACPADTLVLTRSEQWIMGSPHNKPFAGSAHGKVLVESYDLNRARASITCTGFFYTQNPPATAVITISV